MAGGVAAANRGKYAEGKVRDILKKFDGRCVGFDFNRCLDAHAAGGRFPAQAGDFQAFRKGWVTIEPHPVGRQFEPLQDIPMSRNFIIEVKEVKHGFRLPHGNYSVDSVARVQKRVWAGTEAVVAILFKPAYVWRLIPFDVFTARSGGSWDLSAYPTKTLAELEMALSEFMGVM